MAKNQINLNEIHLLHLKELAIVNDLKTTNQELVDLGLLIASKAIKSLDKESFENIIGLKSL